MRDPHRRSRSDVDLRDRRETERLVARRERPDAVVPRGREGRRHPRQRHAIRPNSSTTISLIETNVIHAAHRAGVEKLVFLGSSCIYPSFAPQPMQRGRAADRPAGADQRMVRHRQDRRHQALPGLSPAIWLRFHLGHADQSLRSRRQLSISSTSHVVAGADPQVPRGQARAAPTRSTIWGTGTPRREFLHVDDLADACVFLMKNYSDERTVNIGSGRRDHHRRTRRASSPRRRLRGQARLRTSRPDGTPRKLLDVGPARRARLARIDSLRRRPRADLFGVSRRGQARGMIGAVP